MLEDLHSDNHYHYHISDSTIKALYSLIADIKVLPKTSQSKHPQYCNHLLLEEGEQVKRAIFLRFSLTIIANNNHIH
jgi:hypothetical protein